MCVICYELAGDEHWSDAVSFEGQDTPAARARHRRLGVLKVALAPYGLTVSAPGNTRHVVIANRKGASEVASGLPAVWLAAQRLSSRRVDVLDPALVDALGGACASGEPT